VTSDRTISILFMIGSACMVVNLGTCLGALCFLAGAYLLLPRSRAKRTLTVGSIPA
jgi:hypothetical protein